MKWELLIFFCLLSIVKSQSCDDGWEAMLGSCFNAMPDSLNWTDARIACQTKRTGADLAIARDADELRNIYEYILQFNLKGSFWLGGSDLEFEGTWVWIDTSRILLGTPFWALNNDLFGWSHEPQGGDKQNCLSLNKERFYYFDDLECDSNNHPVCMY